VAGALQHEALLFLPAPDCGCIVDPIIFMKRIHIIPLVVLSLNACAVNDSSTLKPSIEPRAEEKPSTKAVPQKVIDDCLAALAKQVGERPMKVIVARRGEASFIVDVRVDGVENLWRCYHDGTSCTGTEYQGEG
jgi:hypothetical protein